MDNPPNIPCCQCVVCGNECIIDSNGEDASTRVEDKILFSIFLRCVSSSSDEIDSSILSELDSVVNCSDDDGLVFCSTCKSALIEWDKLYEDLDVVIAQKLDRIKFTFYAKILNNNVPGKSDTHVRKNLSGHDEVSDDQKLLFVQKIQRVKDQICRQFNPRVVLKRISGGGRFEGRASENSVNGFDEDEFEAVSEIRDDHDDDFIENSKLKEDPLSVEDEPNDGGENNHGSKTFTLPNTASKPIGPGKFLYLDKYVFFQKNNKFECAECSTVITRRGHMLRHIRVVHIKDEEVSSDQQQGSANAGHDDDWEIAAQGSGDDDDDVEMNSLDSGDDDAQARKRSKLDCTKRGASNRKTTRKDIKRCDIVSSGPNEWMYADKYKIIFNSEEERYYCGLCCAVRSERAELIIHIKEQHIDGKFTKQTALRQTGPNDYIYRDKYKVTVDKNDDWYCGECGAQRKNRVAMVTHIRKGHIDPRKGPTRFCTFDEVSPNQFLYNGKYSFRFDPNQELYLCSLCDYTNAGTTGVLAHIRTNHYTDADKQEHRAVEVAPGEYLYGGRYKILLENGRFRCTLCNRIRETLTSLYPHFRVVHPDGSGETSQNSSVPRGENDDAAQKPNAPYANKTTAPVTDAEKALIRQLELTRLRKAISKGWKIQGSGKWVYKNNWQVVEQNGKYKCLACDMQEGDRRTTFNHVQGVHAQEKGLVKPAVPVRRDELTELEYMGIAYKYDPTEEKYACSLCNTKSVDRNRMNVHIREKHIDPQKFICDICGQEYDSRLQFRRHQARHEGPKYACRHCDKRFTADRYLRTHLKIHMGEDAKKHQCEFCGKKFYTLKQLKNHRPTHTGEKTFPCDLCGESFSTTFKRREHRKKFHGGLPQKHGWKPTEGNLVVQPLHSVGEDLTATETETDSITLG